MSDSSHVKAYRAKHLAEGEEIKASAKGYIGKMMGSGKDTQHNGALIVTGKAVIFYRKGLFGEVNQSIPLDKITSIEQASLLGHRTLRIHTSHDDLEFKTLEGDKYPALLEAIESGRKRGPGGTSDPLAALQKLGELHAAGVLSDAEFASKKADLLSKV